jgi:uncharacterized protein YcnI
MKIMPVYRGQGVTTAMSMMRRLLAGGVLAAALVGLAAAPALAHVTVSSPDATKGGYGVLTFRVPTESGTASTTRLTVRLPTGQPLASVSVKPVPGWTFKTTTTKLATPVRTDDGVVREAVSTVEWTASSPAGAIKPGEYNDFSISAGPLPDADTMTFKVIQTYSDGRQVAWIEQSAGGAEPAHPAPTLTLAAGTGPAGTASAAAGAAPAPAAGPTAAAPASSGTATTALVLGTLGLLTGLAGLGLALASRRRLAVPTPTPTVEAGSATARGTGG